MVELGKIFMGENAIEFELSSMVEDHLTEEQQRKLDTLWQEMASIIEFGLLEHVKED